MDFPFLLLALLVLPIVVAGVIVAVSVGRRRARASTDVATESEHRLQTDSAAAQDAADHPAPVAPRASSARRRRAAAAVRQSRG